ncbi:hypothetical protein M885DRAFT_135729 [Pelagophyceae sp. CCMP2097]|nr:hypothetical protein M885DRAFT_135729 [Pelagophyceae sp. CCMP2097]
MASRGPCRRHQDGALDGFYDGLRLGLEDGLETVLKARLPDGAWAAPLTTPSYGSEDGAGDGLLEADRMRPCQQSRREPKALVPRSRSLENRIAPLGRNPETARTRRQTHGSLWRTGWPLCSPYGPIPNRGDQFLNYGPIRTLETRTRKYKPLRPANTNLCGPTGAKAVSTPPGGRRRGRKASAWTGPRALCPRVAKSSKRLEMPRSKCLKRPQTP